MACFYDVIVNFPPQVDVHLPPNVVSCVQSLTIIISTLLPSTLTLPSVPDIPLGRFEHRDILQLGVR